MRLKRLGLTVGFFIIFMQISICIVVLLFVGATTGGNSFP